MNSDRIASIYVARLALLLTAAISTAFYCGPATTQPDAPETPEAVTEPGLPAGLVREVEANPRFQELARFIAGRELEQGAELYPLTTGGSYQAYRKRVRAAWERYETNHLAALRKWNPTLKNKGCGPNVFYPFSGPDITHAVSLFPDAPTYILFGLEKVGPIPSPLAKNESGEAKKLNAVFEAVGDVLGRNFFKTIDMAVEVGQNDYSGVAGLLLFFLGNLDYEVLNGFPVVIAADGSIREHASAGVEGPATGVTYFFRKAGGPVQQVSYFSINLADSAFGENVKNFLKGRRSIVTKLKAASYLMYRPSFDGMRSTILGRSNCVLTDASGVPFHYLNNARWNLELFGVYRRPVPLFKSRFQPDFFVTLKEAAPERLPFSYGYNYGPGLSHLVFAVRDLERNPYFAPTFDDSASIGDNTVWLADKRTMIYERKFANGEVSLDKTELSETKHERPTLHKKKKQ
ncbi:MAG: hypothetical protein RIF32_02840 [Leptospirales bacterium]|jgi:hypothetical protein